MPQGKELTLSRQRRLFLAIFEKINRFNFSKHLIADHFEHLLCHTITIVITACYDIYLEQIG